MGDLHMLFTEDGWEKECACPIGRDHDEGSAARGRRFEDQYLDITDLADLPAGDPLIDGVLMRDSYHLLTGRDGTLKTFTALDWSLCLATGKRWQSRDIAIPTVGTSRHRVLYVVGEGAYGFKARVAAWEQAWSTPIPPYLVVIRRSAVNLYRLDDAFGELLEHVEAGRYQLVVFDTLRRMSGGADANSSDMGVVVDNLDRIKRATFHGSVLVVAHTDKADNDTRGFSGIEDDADVVWHAKRDDAGTLTLKNTKMKDGPDGGTFLLQPRPILDSLVLEAAHPDRADIGAGNDTDALVLATMRDVFAVTGASATDLIDVTGLSKSAFYRSRSRLIRAGLLRPTGPSSRQRLELPESHPVPSDENRPDLLVSHLSHQSQPESPESLPVPPPLGGGTGNGNGTAPVEMSTR